MLGLLQDSLENQAVGAMLWEFACIADHAIVSNQLIVVAGSVVGDGMGWAGIMPTGKQYSFSVVWQSMWELFNIANLCIHLVFLSCWHSIKFGDDKSPWAVNFLHDISVSHTCQVVTFMCNLAGTSRKRPVSATSVSSPSITSAIRGSNGSTFTTSWFFSRLLFQIPTIRPSISIVG